MNDAMFINSLKDLGIHPTDMQLEQLKRYYELLISWNEKMNLTGITEKEHVYLKHFYDSTTLFSAVDLTKENTLCDIGTGAGFPGLVLKILFPNLKVTLVDSLNKRIEFLKVVIKELGLTEIEAVHARIEEYGILNKEKFDVVTARAVAPLNILLEYSIPLVKVGKTFIAMKANAEEELETSAHALKVLDSSILKVHTFTLPIEKSNRTLIVIKKEKTTNKKYPRKYSDIKKRPL